MSGKIYLLLGTRLTEASTVALLSRLKGGAETESRPSQHNTEVLLISLDLIAIVIDVGLAVGIPGDVEVKRHPGQEGLQVDGVAVDTSSRLDEEQSAHRHHVAHRTSMSRSNLPGSNPSCELRRGRTSSWRRRRRHSGTSPSRLYEDRSLPQRSESRLCRAIRPRWAEHTRC